MPRGGVLEHERPRHVPAPRGTDGEDVDVLIGDAPVLAFRPLAGRVAACLVMPGIDRRIDVSVSPRTALLALRQSAEQHGMPPSQVEASARRSLDAAVAVSGAWAPGRAIDGDELTARLGGAAFPLLGAAYDAGAAGLDELPRWAAPIVAGATARDGARIAFGSGATRPVVAALARSLSRVEGEPVDLSRLALALIASDALEPDRIARVLTMDGHLWPAQQLPEPHVLDDGRRAAARWGAGHTARYLEEACATDSGLATLTDCIRYATDLGAHAPRRLPTHLGELHDCYRARFTTPPPPTHDAPRRRRRAVQATDDRPAPAPDRPDEGAPPPRVIQPVGHPREGYGLRLAPPTPAGVHAQPRDRIPHPTWLRTIDGAKFDGFRIVLPGACGDLVVWSRLLSNCLDSYTRAAKSGRSHLIGVECDTRLRYVVEVTPQHRIRQFAGRSNRLPSVEHHDRIVAFLSDHQIVR